MAESISGKSIFGQITALFTAITDLRKLTLLQQIELACWVGGAAVAGYSARHDWSDAALGAVGMFVAGVRQLYVAPPGTVALPAKNPEVQAARIAKVTADVDAPSWDPFRGK